MIPDLLAAVRRGDRAAVRVILATRPELVNARDADGATALHYAAERGDRELVETLLQAGADINARDGQFSATPAGWAIEYLRQHGALLGIEIDDVARAIELRDVRLVERLVSRLPALRTASDRAGTPLRALAERCGDSRIAQLFQVQA